MKTFNSLDDIAREIHKKDLEKQITLERMKLQVNSFKNRLQWEVIPGEIAQIAGNYLGKMIQNKLKSK